MDRHVLAGADVEVWRSSAVAAVPLPRGQNAAQGVFPGGSEMLHKGFFGAEKGVFLAPQTLRSKKFRLRRQESRLPPAAQPFDFEANAAKKKG